MGFLRGTKDLYVKFDKLKGKEFKLILKVRLKCKRCQKVTGGKMPGIRNDHGHSKGEKLPSTVGKA
ncbi:hypothetical protein CFK37_11235 [Virgibacillus phasianinus]|uniref:Uncharacterized protein n=1 Tax=Virgibacillus phasianinus TaxID=2017483 RepID=A0A220U3L1_9BACI|nr:hypothetical protein [Virgibacillus phasianinus]ASK62677.1 hypothetical protein CFK37_11235 [Virgibacillus phasianinus]